ncbi:MAG: alpha-1,2-fucosyltransferase [Candidatus Paceibacterota bacterium]|jgi:hypothetical protein
MITVNLKGGLGNQMFQYALGRELAVTQKTGLKLDRTGYDREHFRAYGLKVFAIEENFANHQEIKKNKYSLGLASKAWRGFKFKILRVHHTGWEPRVISRIKKEMAQGKDIYLDGYWQSFKYFSDIKEVIQKDFTLKTPLDQTNPELLNQITTTNSVSLAVRRTDYLLTTNLKGLGICSANYYKKAIELIETKIENPAFFVFSDDVDWVKANMKFNSHLVTYVSENKQEKELTDYQELVLMSKCKHNIIANSSFSWWGAWLNENPNKIVIAPDIWFNNGSIKIDDIIPPTWTKLPRN